MEIQRRSESRVWEWEWDTRKVGEKWKIYDCWESEREGRVCVVSLGLGLRGGIKLKTNNGGIKRFCFGFYPRE